MIFSASTQQTFILCPYVTPRHLQYSRERRKTKTEKQAPTDPMDSEYHQASACPFAKQELEYDICSTKLSVRIQKTGNHSHSSVWEVQEPPRGTRGPREAGWVLALAWGLAVWASWKVPELQALVLFKWGGGELSRSSNIFPTFCKIIRKEEEEKRREHFLILLLATKKSDKIHVDHFKGRDYVLSPLPLGGPPAT